MLIHNSGGDHICLSMLREGIKFVLYVDEGGLKKYQNLSFQMTNPPVQVKNDKSLIMLNIQLERKNMEI